uniref:Uncharacterized protein n=1 Tax=Mimivirus LCMiAC02 TaxID=2506609 RepID=A0A481Z1H3_9VIRU|nr:MAG: hypothetical protein LCMiAC02_01040 [Mimivirus LCMiAC02]
MTNNSKNDLEIIIKMGKQYDDGYVQDYITSVYENKYNEKYNKNTANFNIIKNFVDIYKNQAVPVYNELCKHYDQFGGDKKDSVGKKAFTYMAGLVIKVLTSKFIGKIVGGVLKYTSLLLLELLPKITKKFVYKKDDKEINIFPEEDVKLYSKVASSVIKHLGPALKYHMTPKDERENLSSSVKQSINNMHDEIIEAAKKFKTVQTGGEIIIKTDSQQISNIQPLLYNLNKIDMPGGSSSSTLDTEILKNILELNTETVTDTVVNDMIGGTKNSTVNLDISIFTNKLSADTDTDAFINDMIGGTKNQAYINLAQEINLNMSSIFTNKLNTDTETDAFINDMIGRTKN